MHRTEIELDTLSNTDWSGTENKNFLLWIGLYCLILTSVYTVIIWCLCCELCCTGIYHLISSNNAVCVTHLLDFFFGFSSKFCNHIVRELNSLCFFQQFNGKFLGLQALLHLGNNCKLIDKPAVDLCNLVNVIVRYATA